MRYLLALFLTAAVVAMPSLAEAKPHRFHSRHPFKGGFCYIDAPHVHAYAPVDARMYRVVDGEYYFVGDPVGVGYDGPKYAYYGPHAMPEFDPRFGEVYCYLEGPHYHWSAPPPQAPFEVRAGAYWYVGSFAPVFWEARPRYVVINDAYRPIQYTRPAVEVSAAPATWHGVPRERVVARPAGAAPPPTVQVGIGIQFGRPPPPTFVEERVYVGGPPGHYKRKKHDHDDDDDGDDRHEHGRGHGHGHKGKWKD
jgi:hypothetical protein